ncbi:MAG: helical backbone metal receptor [Planctomycetota bacterium]|nr:helical backbone metal receptor [Planctomycetota bacterium]
MMLALLVGGGCERKSGPGGKVVGTRPRVASLVPAATDLLIAMGAGDHLVAISNYDVTREATTGLPRVGDYQTFDWEQIAALRPDVMIVFMTPDRMPAGLKQRADGLGIRLVNVRTERLSDIVNETENLGRVVGEEAKAAREVSRIVWQIVSAAERVRGRERVRTLLVRDKNAEGVVGRENFLNDALEAAGGDNVVKATGWPSIDRELLMTLKPEVIIQLLPEAGAQTVQEAKRVWGTMPDIPAVANGRVYVMTDWWVQNSGSHVGEMAARFVGILHRSDQRGRQ